MVTPAGRMPFYSHSRMETQAAEYRNFKSHFWELIKQGKFVEAEDSLKKHAHFKVLFESFKPFDDMLQALGEDHRAAALRAMLNRSGLANA